MIPLIVVRPQPGADRTVAAARALGLEARGFPLFEVVACPWEAPDAATIDALLIGSANAVRCAGSMLAAFRAKPAYVVGEATASACETAGLDVIAVGQGGLQAVLEPIASPTHLLRLAGEERIELIPPEGVTLTERVVYASRPVPAGSALVNLLRKPCVVALHSAAAARHLTAECARWSLDRSVVRLVTIGPRVSEAAGLGWAQVVTAPAPSDEALLACAAKVCQNRGA